MKKIKALLIDNLAEIFLILGAAGIFIGLCMISPAIAFIGIGIVFLICSYITLNR